MKHFVFWNVFVVLFSGFDSIFDGLFNGCSFIENNPASIHLYCNGSTESPIDDCTSIIESENLPSNITELKISACDVEMTQSLEVVASRILIGLRQLDVSYNKRNPFVNYLLKQSSSEQLEHLIASHCELEEIPTNLESRMPSLVKINFSFNKINEIYPAHLYKVKSLNLSSNQISTLGRFDNFISLENMDLSGSAFTMIYQNAFDKFVNLKTLRIDDTYICNFLRLMFERMVQVDYKNISQLDTTCIDDPLEIEWDYDELVIRNINNGHVKRFRKDQLQNLRSVLFGPNQLKNTTKFLEMLGRSITFLWISGNFIGELTSNIFNRFVELVSLHLDGTNLTLSNFNPFENLSKLVVLSMANNSLQYLNTTVFNKTLNNLIVFDVSYNGLENIDEVIDCLSSRITHLTVSGNPLREIKPDTFARFRNLKWLRMGHTNLQRFDFNVFKNCRNLSHVFLSRNNLTNANFTLPPNENSSVHGLYIDGNNLTELPGLNNASYPSLWQLLIGGNPMSCEYVTKLKEQWRYLDDIGDQCSKQQTSNDNINQLVIETTTENIPKTNTFLIAVIYGVPIGIGVIVAVTLCVVRFIRRQIQAASRKRVLNHIYAEIGPPTNDPSYNHLDFRNLPPNNEILDHYDNDGQDQRDQNNENNLNIGQNIELEEQNINLPYNRLNFDDLPNNKILEHYDNATPNQGGQNEADEAEVVEVDPANVDAPYNHLQLAIPPPNNKISDHYKNAPPQNQVDDSSDSSDSE